MLRTKEYYKILHFLKVESVDRIYPVEEYFYKIDDETGEEVQTYVIPDELPVLFKTNRQQFSGLDYVEVLLETSEAGYTYSDIVLSLSEYDGGYDPIVILDAEEGDTEFPQFTPKRLVFKIRKSQTMSETSRNLTNIKSILLDLPSINFKIHEICFRDNNAPFTLEQLDAFYENGKYYVLSRLHMVEVPPELEDHIYTASAGYAWMSVWEYEARVMNDEQKNAKSYGKWLFAIVDDAIDLYKKANGIADDEVLFVVSNLVTHRRVRW